MDKYENGKIYKIVDNTNNNIYIGHTTEKYLSKRLQHHLYQYKYWKEGKKKYTSSFKIFENNDYRIELLENCNCKDVYELKNRERYYIENNDCINHNVPNRTHKEYQQQVYKKQKSINDKAYRERQGEILLEKKRQFDNEKITCECGCEVNRGNLLRHKKSKKHIDLMNQKN